MQLELTFTDFVLIAAEMRGVSVDELEPDICRPSAEQALAAPFARSGEIDLYPWPAEKAAICCSAIIRSQPLPDRSEDVAYECMREMLVRGGHPWPRPEEDEEEIATKLRGLAADEVSETEFVEWVRARVGLGEWLRYQAKAATA
jgi:hypothetical protein